MEMLRFTKYPLLLDNIAKYTGNHSVWRPLLVRRCNSFPLENERFSVSCSCVLVNSSQSIADCQLFDPHRR